MVRTSVKNVKKIRSFIHSFMLPASVVDPIRIHQVNTDPDSDPGF